MTNRRVISRRGLLCQDVFDDLLQWAEDVDTQQSLPGWLLGYSTIEIHIAAERGVGWQQGYSEHMFRHMPVYRV